MEFTRICKPSAKPDGIIRMRELQNKSISIANILPSLRSHVGMNFTLSDISAICLTRAYQRTRMRSYCHRGIRLGEGDTYSEVHIPYDLFSYHIILHRKYELDCAQQVRVYQNTADLHYSVTRYMVDHGMLSENALEATLRCIEDAGYDQFAQVGGWISHPGYPFRVASTMPIVCWAFNRIFSIPFVYAICRIDNGAADLLERIGGFRISKDYMAWHYNGLARIMGFSIDEVSRCERRIMLAEEHLRECAKLYIGTTGVHEVDIDCLFDTECIPIGGWDARIFPISGQSESHQYEGL